MTSTCKPFSRRRAIAGPASLAERPPPAAGLTMAKKRFFTAPGISCQQYKNEPLAAKAAWDALKREPTLLHKGRTAEARSCCARRSARILRLILSDAVRGKSLLKRTIPCTRL